MVKSTIDDIKDITLERQIRKLADVIDEQNKKIDATVDYSTDIDNLKASDINQTIQINNLKQTVATDKLATDSAITALQSKDVEQDGTITDHATQIQDITESLVSGVQIMPGTTTGDIKVRLERESAAAIDSNNYNLGLPVSAEVIQGTGPSMFKIQITMSSGVKVVSNDFVFTTEAIGNDVYISSFTFKAGNQTGYLSADIGLNNGVVIEANNFLVPTDPNVTSAITDLQNRVSAVESTGVAGFNELKTTVEGHTTAINELNTDVADLTTNKADVNNSNQTIVAGTVNATNINKGSVPVATVNDIPDISGKVNIAQGVENAGKVLSVGEDGNVIPTIISVGGIEKIDLNNWPTDWAEGDIIFITLHCYIKSTATSWEDTTRNVLSINNNDFNPWPFGRGAFSWIAGSTSNTYLTFPIESVDHAKAFISIVFPGLTAFNRTSTTLCYISADGFNGASGSLSISGGDIEITSPSQLANYVTSIYRIKAS